MRDGNGLADTSSETCRFNRNIEWILLSEERIRLYPDRRCTPTRKMGQVIEDRDGSLWVQDAAGSPRWIGRTPA